MTKRFAKLGTMLAVVAVLAGCGGAEIGEECDEQDVGSSDPCVEGGICDSESSSSDLAVCLEICEVDEDCAEGYHCTGVSRSNQKACHADE